MELSSRYVLGILHILTEFFYESLDRENYRIFLSKIFKKAKLKDCTEF